MLCCWSDVDQILLSKFTNMTSDSRISDQRLRSKRTGSMIMIVNDHGSLKNERWLLYPTHIYTERAGVLIREKPL